MRFEKRALLKAAIPVVALELALVPMTVFQWRSIAFGSFVLWAHLLSHTLLLPIYLALAASRLIERGYRAWLAILAALVLLGAAFAMTYATWAVVYPADGKAGAILIAESSVAVVVFSLAVALDALARWKRSRREAA